MKDVIKKVLDKFSEQQTNLSSESAKERIAEEIEKALERSDNYLYENKENSWKCEICKGSTYNLDADYIGTGTNHLSCEVRLENDRQIMKKERKNRWPGLDAIQKQVYNEMTADGLPSGGDTQAVLESHKLAEEIVGKNNLGYIFESPDGGETIYRRKVGESKKELISKEDWKEYNRNR
tara:strand:+ start:9 stop:545 length:537 start_codon:yes stop_codon:yes gene_type:complete